MHADYQHDAHAFIEKRLSTPRWQFCKGNIVARRELAGEYVRLTISAPTIAAVAGPGQFVMLRSIQWGQLLLNRPFDIYLTNVRAGTIDVIFKLKGEGTHRLADLRVNDNVGVMGPLGCRLAIEQFPAGIGLVGRGAGASPMVELARACHEAGIPAYALISARSTDRLIGVDQLKEYAREVKTLTDDDDAKQGPRTIMESWIARDGQETPGVQAIYTCGSRRLGRAVLRVTTEHRIAGFIFMETRMGCGIGTCHGCSVPVQDKQSGGMRYALDCVEGPAFPIESTHF